MNDLLARSPVFYRESADGRLVFGNKTALEPGGFIELVIGTDTFRVPVDDKGFYRWEAPTPYADGEYSFSIRHFDAAGNRSTPTLGTVIVDTTPPSAPDLINLYDDQGAVTGSFDAGKATDDKRPTLTGIAQKGSTVYLLNDKNEKIGSAVADKVSGKWVIEPSQDLKDGVNSLRLMAEETFGGKLRAGTPSQAFDIVIAGDDVKVTITDALDDAGSFTGSLGHGALTDDATPTLRGEVSAGSTVIVYYRLAGSPTWAGSATATVSGETWSWTPGSNLPDGRYEFQASTGEVASVLFELEIAGTAGIAQRTRIESVTDDFGPVTGPLANGAMTDDATPTFQGRAEANSQVVIRYTLAGGAAASVTVNADSTGHWRWTPGVNLATGQWTFDVKSQGQSGWNDSFTLTINPDADRNATIDSALDDFGPVTGSLSSGSSTDDTTPTLRGSGPANSEITLRYKLGNGGYTSITVNVDSSGHWTWTPSALAKGSWTFEVQKAGQSDWSSFTLTVDPTLDRNATINGAYDDFGTVKGIIANGGITDDATPTLNGSGPANSVISLRYKLGSGGYASTTVNVDAAGNWTWTPSALASGKWTFEVQKPGQSGWSSFTLTIDPTVDRKPTIDSAWDDVGPTTGLISNGGTTDDSTPTLRGTGPANSTILLRYFRLATLVEGTIKVDASGNWTWTAPELTDGNWTFEVKKEGQHEWSSYELNIDVSADRYPTIDSALDNAGPVTGSLSSGSSTDDTTPTLRGSGPANGSITLRYKLDGGSYASTTVNVDSAGKWTWTPSALAKGSWTFEVQKAGQSGWSSFQLTVDPALDLKPTIDGAWDDFGAVTGSLASGDTTDDSTPTLRGRGVAGSVIYFQSGTAGGSWYDAGSTVVKADGSWEWTSPALSRNGTWEFRAKASHGGVDSTWTGKFVLEYVASAPAVPTITDAFDDYGASTGSIANGGTTDDETPMLRGTGVPGSVIIIEYGLTTGSWISAGSALVQADGKWEFTSPKLSENGDWEYRAKSVMGSSESDWSDKFGVHFESPGASGGDEGVEDFESYEEGYKQDNGPLYLNNGLKYESFWTFISYGKDVKVYPDAGVQWTSKSQGLVIVRRIDISTYQQKMNRLSFGEETSAVSFDYHGSFFSTNKAKLYDKDNILIGEILFEKTPNDIIKETYFRAPHGKMISYIEFELENSLHTPPPNIYNRLNIDNLRWGDKAIEHHDNIISNQDITPPEDGVQIIADVNNIYAKKIIIEADEPHFDLHNLEREANSLTTIQLSENGDVELKVSIEDILHLGQKDLFIEDGKTQLMVNGDAGDVVQLKDILPEGSDISEWQHQQGTVTVAGVEYEVYSHGDDAELLVQLGVKTELI
ncbi:Ig-like domain-containing protein [Pantoea sp. SS70]|uniref:Ig-like domain-containing protein n=1 Tax=Pantoea sp. SS70 TaxID=3024247 RepID=UPI002452CF69|nr:Ig-like domain-containing protein [Pantoea sp. SS70]WGK55891.1 Ig-like domain-containing protein [Pantoea sp. SS70]